MNYTLRITDDTIYAKVNGSEHEIGTYTTNDCYFSICNGVYWMAFNDGEAKENADEFMRLYGKYLSE